MRALGSKLTAYQDQVQDYLVGAYGCGEEVGERCHFAQILCI